jgi:hypothetical protein
MLVQGWVHKDSPAQDFGAFRLSEIYREHPLAGGLRQESGGARLGRLAAPVGVRPAGRLRRRERRRAIVP